jgi:uncharacterized protein (UPF0261 family)
MLAIGRALLTNPRLLLLDEPSEGLAPLVVEGLVETCKTLTNQGVGLLLIEQNLGVATALADRLLVMVAGEIAKETTSRLVVDTGVREPAFEPDVRVADEAGVEWGDRAAAMEALGRGAASALTRLHGEGRLQGVLALGGSGGTSVATTAMRALPVGVPKLMVSTMASGDTRPYVGAVDVTMMYSVVDIVGINPISERILANAAAAIAGMVQVELPEPDSAKPLIGATMVRRHDAVR